MTEHTSQTGPAPSPEQAPPANAQVFVAPRPGWGKRVLLGLFLLGAFGVMAFNLTHPGRPQRLRLLAGTEARMESMMLALEHENTRLMAELERLERGADGWQALARKEYGMLLPGEVVYRFPAATR